MDFLLNSVFTFGLTIVLILMASCFAPKLVLSVGTRPVLPILGMAVLSVLTSLWHLSSFSVFDFQLVCFFVSLIGIFRLFRLRTQLHISFDKDVVIIGLLLLPIAIVLGVNAFDVDDEIYSWNLWAKQIFLKEPIDYYFTQAPYPTLFSSYIAGVYILAGSTDYQSMAKLSLWLLPYCFLLLLWSLHSHTKRWLFWLVAILVVYGLDLAKSYSIGLADPLMSSLLFVGVYCLLNVKKNPDIKDTHMILLAAFFVSLSAITKQAALVWSIGFFPLAMIVYSKKNQLPNIYIGLAFIPVIVSLLWLFTIGTNFHRNEGVIEASMGGRDYFQQLFFALSNLVKEYPIAVLLLPFMFWFAFSSKDVWLKIIGFGCFVSMMLWLFFGSYDIRLGMHVFLLLWLVFCIQLPTINMPTFEVSKAVKVILLALMSTAPINYALSKYVKLSSSYVVDDKVLPFNHGYEKQTIKLFGNDGFEIAKKLRSENVNV